jgi:hypothetical protein
MMKQLTMKTFVPSAMMGLLLMAGPGYAANATDQEHDHHSHDHGHADQSGLVLNQGERWATDAALREGMLRIRAAVVDAVPAHEHGHLDGAEARSLAGTIEGQVTYLVENCKLEPEADAVLHQLLAELLQGTATLMNTPDAPDGLPRIVGVLRDYPVYFAHPGWVPIGEGR